MIKICEEWPQVTAIKNFQEGAKFSPDRGFSVSPIRRWSSRIPRPPTPRNAPNTRFGRNPDKPDLTPDLPNSPTKLPLLRRPNSNPMLKFPGFPDFSDPKSPTWDRKEKPG